LASSVSRIAPIRPSIMSEGVGRLQRRLDDREQGHHRHPQLHALLRHGKEAVHAASLHTRHAGHVLHQTLAVEHEDRQDQVFAGQAVLTHQGARGRIAAQAARAASWKGRRIHGRGLSAAACAGRSACG
jgi:hypothetical protein